MANTTNRVSYLKTLKAAKLKKLCTVIGLPTSGNKATLAGRIASREREAINGR